jgi:lipopolysaccharide/colanic/teichoic acid biosynthesis glycosyltransferase
MVVDAATRGPSITTAVDARVTRAGVWLREHRIDELPQLLDVIAGHMSLVGPRPELPHFVALYPPTLREQVLSVRPGLTDPASLAFADEARTLIETVDAERRYIDEILPRKLRCQAEYAQRATLASDVAVLARTAALLLGWRKVTS